VLTFNLSKHNMEIVRRMEARVESFEENKIKNNGDRLNISAGTHATGLCIFYCVLSPQFSTFPPNLFENMENDFSALKDVEAPKTFLQLKLNKFPRSRLTFQFN
jgi:hypothetical protein